MPTPPPTTRRLPAAYEEDDLLWRQLKTVPAFRALLRAVESRFYRGVQLAEPVLDVGCGDGHFAEMTFNDQLAAGIDPWWGPLKLARGSGIYDLLLQAQGDELPFPDHYFGSAFSNSVLEHIPDLPPVLREVSRVLQPDGRFLITIPSHLFNEYLGGTAFFRNLGLPGLAERYQALADRITRHAHTEPPEWWAAQLAAAGFSIERWQYYFSPAATRALEWGHLQGVPAAVMRALTGHWIIAPWKSSLRRTEQWVRPFYEEPFGSEGAYLLIVARKKADQPVPVQLPPARPFRLEELSGKPAAAPAVEPEPAPITAPAPTIQTETPAETSPAPDQAGKLLPPLLILASLLLAIIGQTISQTSGSGDQIARAAGLRWFAYSAVPLLLLVWLRRPRRAARFRRLPALGEIPRRRYFIFLAVIEATLARSAGGGLAWLLWLLGIGTALYALSDPGDWTAVRRLRPGRQTLLTGAALFIIALALRLVNLGGLPFVLNGIEASLGLDVLQISRSQIANPFATGWLTNPLLPLYLNAIPVQILGPSTIAMRLISPFVGAVTVLALYLIARKLWDETIALLAALLLTGAHFHMHYSRLGMTNIWDPLLVLLALGSLLILWRRPAHAPYQRTGWLVAGLFIGLNAYGFTSSRLLPLMLAALLLLLLLTDRATLRRQGAHLFAALLLAFVVSLPIFLFYRSNPSLFMERANALGIFAGQTSWLPAEAARSGLPAGTILWQQIRTAMLSFNIRADASPVYRPQVPLLSFGPAVFYVLGSLLAASRAMGKRGMAGVKHGALLIWLLVTMLFAGAFLLDVPQSHRLLIATPALALLAAIGLAEVGRVAWTAVAPTHLLLRNPLFPLTLLALLFALNDVAFYFSRFPDQHQYADTNTETAAVLADYLAERDNSWTAFFFGPPVMYADFPTFPFLAPQFQKGINFFDVAPDEFPPPPARQGGLLFIFLPGRMGELTAVQTQYPGGREIQFNGYYAEPLFTLYEVAP